MSDFHFIRPLWLLGLPLLIAIFLWLWRRRLRSRSWEAVCDPELLPHLLIGRSQQRANWPLWLLAGALVLAILALAGPAWRKSPQPLFRQQSALVILLDLSRSMHAADLKPSRLERTRLKVKDLLRLRREGATALVAFAGDAFVVTPLTEDTRTIESLLDSLDPELMPVQGSQPDRAIKLGSELLQQAGLKRGRLLLVTDEDRPERALAAAKTLQKQGYELEILGVGTPAGAPIPLADGGFFKDEQGNLVLPPLNAAGLQQLAQAGGGSYRSLSIDDSDLQALTAGLDSHRLDQAQATAGKEGPIWREEGVWLLWPLVLLAPFAFRRGWLVVLALIFFLPAGPAQAMTWSGLWQRPDQQGAKAFADKKYEEAGQTFQDPRWKASALYRAGHYPEAAEALKEGTSADDSYNRGNALARSGQLEPALAAYEEALKLAPEDADAKYNRDLVEKSLKEQEEKSDKGKKDQKDQAGKKDQKGQKDQQGSQKGKDQQQGKDAKPSPSQDGKSSQDQAQPDKASPAQSGEEKKSPNKEATGEEQQSQDTATGKQENAAAAVADQTPTTEEERATKEWLQRIPDDPGGLLRRKFLYQYRQRGRQTETDRPW